MSAQQQPPFNVVAWGFEWRKWIGDFFSNFIQRKKFAAELTGFAANLDLQPTYHIYGNLVTLVLPAIEDTSTTTSMTLTGLPDEITPKYNSINLPVIGVDNGAECLARAEIMGTGSPVQTIRFYRGSVSGTRPQVDSLTQWTASGNKGLAAVTLTYPLTT